jgi:hypothetical protein
MLLPPNRLPDFDQTAIDRRFLAEVDRLLKAGAFASHRELADILNVRTSIVSDIGSGRTHCNLKLLYNLAQYYPTADVQTILFGSTENPSTGPINQPGVKTPR